MIRDSVLAQIPVLVLTAGDRVDAKALEGAPILRKPLNVPTLSQAVEEHC